MLILTRRVGEKIIIGPNITVIVLGHNGNHISIGIEAPKDVDVDREEIRVQKDAKRASDSGGRPGAKA